MIVKNLTEALTRMRLADFLEKVAGNNGLVLNKEALDGTEWQIGLRNGRGMSMLAFSVSRDGLNFLTMSAFTVRSGVRKRMLFLTTDGDQAYSVSWKVIGENSGIWDLNREAKEDFKNNVLMAARSILTTRVLSRKGEKEIKKLVAETVMLSSDKTTEQILELVDPEAGKILIKEKVARHPAFVESLRKIILREKAQHRLIERATSKVSL